MPRLKQEVLDDMLKQERRVGYALAIFHTSPKVEGVSPEHRDALLIRQHIYSEEEAIRRIP